MTLSTRLQALEDEMRSPNSHLAGQIGDEPASVVNSVQVDRWADELAALRAQANKTDAHVEELKANVESLE